MKYIPRQCKRCGNEVSREHDELCFTCRKALIVRRCPKCDMRMAARTEAQGRYIVEFYLCGNCGLKIVANRIKRGINHER